MATQSYEELIASATKIKNNELPESNTHDVVGDHLVQMATKAQEEYNQRVTGICEYNVSKQFPTGGIEGSNKYTLELALQKVPTELRQTVGIKCSFLGDDGTLESWEYQGGTFTATGSWLAVGGKKVAELEEKEKLDITSINRYINSCSKLSVINPTSTVEGVRYDKNDLEVADASYSIATYENVTGDVLIRFEVGGTKNNLFAVKVTNSDGEILYSLINPLSGVLLPILVNNSTIRICYRNFLEPKLEMFTADLGRSLNGTIQELTLDKFKNVPNEGNLLDPDKVIKGYYVGKGGIIYSNELYGYIYIPMKGYSVSCNSLNGAVLVACDKYGNITHSNEENQGAQTYIDYVDGDEFALVSVRLSELGNYATISYGKTLPSYTPYGYFSKNDGEILKNQLIGVQNNSISKSELLKENLLDTNDPDYLEGSFLANGGGLLENTRYSVSGYIPFTESMGKIIASVNGNPLSGGAFLCLYNSTKTHIKSVSVADSNGVLVWEANVAYARFSFQNYTEGNLQVEVGDTITDYIPYGEPKIKNELLPDGITEVLDKVNKQELLLNSSLGEEVISQNSETLEDGQFVYIEDFPYHIKKGIILSFYAKLSLFGSILIGKGYNEYRGDWIKIDATNATLQHYESDLAQDRGTIAHGLSINSFIQVMMYGDDSGKLLLIINTNGGYAKLTFENWGYEANWKAFVKSEGSVLSDIKFSGSNKDFRKPVWSIGDSYFGIYAGRWPGTMREFGFFNFLINGLAGQGSSGAYNDLIRMLNYGTPKYLLWCLGMNDGDSTFISYFDKVRSLCDEKGITLIASTIPTVPERNKEVISQYVRDSGVRYIDFYKAVGANSEGVWYEGYLSSDNVHPTKIGADALASQVLIDFPELMQYGLTSTTGEISDAEG